MIVEWRLLSVEMPKGCCNVRSGRAKGSGVCLAQPAGLGNEADATPQGPTARPFGEGDIRLCLNRSLKFGCT